MRRTGVGVFTLELEYEGRIHRYAKNSYNDLIADIVREVPQLAELDEDQIAKDAATYLTDAEKITFNRFSTDIKNCLQQCIDVVDNNRAYTYSIELIGAMYKLKGLFRRVYRHKEAEAETERAEKERKAEAERREREEQAEAEQREKEEKARAEQRKREEKAEAERREREEQEREREKRAQAERKKKEEEEALREARQKEQEEQQRKLEAERRARQKRIEEQEREREAERKAKQQALEAKRRAEQEERERLAQVKAEFTRAEEEFKQKLSEDKLPLTYPLEHYHPDLWFKFEPPTDNEILTWLRPQANALIPQQLRKIVSWPTQLVTWRWLSKPRILIQAYYEKNGVPCLVFNFMVTILVRAIFYFKAGSYNYRGFSMKITEEERLGEVVIQKEGYEYAGELSVPISLLLLLITDQLEAKGFEVTSMYDNYTVYRVSGFKGEVTIHSDFRRFLRDTCGENGLVKGLLAWGLIGNQVAEIVEARINEPRQLQPEQKPLPIEDRVKRKDTKKAKAFQLFDEGGRPGDPKVKGLGIKPKTAYRYYQDWKKVHYNSKNPT